MRNFILGVIITLLLLVLGGLAIAMLGLLPTNADTDPPAIEHRVAMSALDASMERHAPRVTNPMPPTDDNLIGGMKIYTMNCAVCHGGPGLKATAIAQGLNPPPPNLFRAGRKPHTTEIFWFVKNGVKMTGMPSFGKTHPDTDIWAVTAFLRKAP